MTYKHLTYAQRCKISAFHKAGFLQKDIAAEAGVSPSTVSRELKRNKRWNGLYCPDQAQSNTKLRRKNSRKPIKFTSDIETYIIAKLQIEWSPEQISGYAKTNNIFDISHERIYKFIWENKLSGGTLFEHLRFGKRRRKKSAVVIQNKGFLKNRIMIDERPSIVDEKSRLGDWEIDTIVGKQGKKAIVTLVERVSKKTLIGRVGTKQADFVSKEAIALLTPFKENVFTITSDNGGEFCFHQQIAKALNIDFYFAHPYHSWERGLNENTNGLIRQYIKKGSDFDHLNNMMLEEIQNKLNDRPRKSLGYSTPNEIWSLLSAPLI